MRTMISPPSSLERCIPLFIGKCLDPAARRHKVGSDIASPPVKVGLQCRPALKAPSGNRVLLHMTDATLVFPFGARPVGGTSVRPKTPMLGKGVQPSIKLDLSGRPVMTHHQPPIIPQQHLFVHPTQSP